MPEAFANAAQGKACAPPVVYRRKDHPFWQKVNGGEGV
jgi:hypothetical protein